MNIIWYFADVCFEIWPFEEEGRSVLRDGGHGQRSLWTRIQCITLHSRKLPLLLLKIFFLMLFYFWLLMVLLSLIIIMIFFTLQLQLQLQITCYYFLSMSFCARHSPFNRLWNEPDFSFLVCLQLFRSTELHVQPWVLAVAPELLKTNGWS